MKSNPPWAAKLLKEVWPTLQKRVTDPALLPKDGPKTKEYGCGTYGCVLPTNLPGIVCKITTDTTEAKFVAAALELFDEDSTWPVGMVRYFAVYQIPNKKFRKRPIFVIWRAEAARNNSHIDAPVRQRGEDYQTWKSSYGEEYFDDWDKSMVRLAQTVGNELRAKLQGRGTSREVKPAVVNMMFYYLRNAPHQDVESLRYRVDSPGFVKSIPKGGLGAAWLYKMLESILIEMQNNRPTHYVGEAMEYYLYEGILLADVHMSNIRTDVPAATGDNWSPINLISDPGHAVFLDPRWADIKIPVL